MSIILVVGKGGLICAVTSHPDLNLPAEIPYLPAYSIISHLFLDTSLEPFYELVATNRRLAAGCFTSVYNWHTAPTLSFLAYPVHYYFDLAFCVPFLNHTLDKVRVLLLRFL